MCARGDAFEDDSAASMAFRGWWEELRRDTEIMPNLRNVKERQIDYIEVGELFNECRQDLIESGTFPEAIGSQVCTPAPRERSAQRAPLGLGRR